MVAVIKAIVDGYAGILEIFRKDDFINHDKAFFEKFDTIPI